MVRPIDASKRASCQVRGEIRCCKTGATSQTLQDFVGGRYHVLVAGKVYEECRRGPVTTASQHQNDVAKRDGLYGVIWLGKPLKGGGA